MNVLAAPDLNIKLYVDSGLETKQETSCLADDEFKILGHQTLVDQKKIRVTIRYFGKINDDFIAYKAPLIDEDIKRFTAGLMCNQIIRNPFRLVLVRLTNKESSQVPQELIRNIIIDLKNCFTCGAYAIETKNNCSERTTWTCALY
jgi:hypothetical protein